MPYAFTDPAAYPYQPGGFFLGLDDHNREVGIRSERHLITIAGARSGKGAALIVPNLKRWSGSCVVVDPKGENATETAVNRSAMGQLVGVVDPYEIAKGEAAALRCSINPLALLDVQSLSIRADLEALGDGLIRRFDPKHAQWDNTAAAICAGIADFIISTEPPDAQNLLSVRNLLLQPDDTLKAVALAMTETNTRAGLARQAGVSILNKFSNPEGVPASAFNRTIEETGWIDDPAFASILGGVDLRPFDLAALKAGNGSLYLCIPPRLLPVRGSFLRLFVSMGLHVMAGDLAEPDDKAGRCLFLLDEFHSLGKLDLVAKAAGLLPGYGVTLWPFLQDLGQLTALYGDDETGTFFGNSDAQIFFGNTDQNTLGHISEMIGDLTATEIVSAPPELLPYDAWYDKKWFKSEEESREILRMEQQNRQNEYHHAMQQAGKPRLTPEQVAAVVGKKDGDKVARSALVFAKGGDVLKVRLQPHFEPAPPVIAAAPAASVQKRRELLSNRFLVTVSLIFLLIAVALSISNGVSVWFFLLFLGLGSGVGFWLAKRT